MVNISPKLGLSLPDRTDPFNTDVLKGNWNIVDAAPGSTICTSTTRPTNWTTAQAGRKIIETDTKLEWMWDGAKFIRLYGSGLLKCSDGSWAIGERTTDFQTAATTFVVVVSVKSVVVPPGNRPIRVDISALNIYNGAGKGINIGVVRGSTNNSGPIQGTWNIFAAGTDIGSGQVFYTIERNGLAPGTYDFSFQIRNLTSGTAFVRTSGNSPASIHVSEM